MNHSPRFRTSRLLPFALAITLPLAAQWAPPVIALHLKIGKAEDQLGAAVDTPDVNFLGGVDRDGNIILTDQEKMRILIYGSQGNLSSILIIPESVKPENEDNLSPIKVITHPTEHRLLLNTGLNHYCFFSYDKSISRCFAVQRLPSPDYSADYVTPQGFAFKQSTYSWGNDSEGRLKIIAKRDECIFINREGNVSAKPGKCPPEPETWDAGQDKNQLQLSGMRFNAMEMAKPDGWNYVLVRPDVAVGQCAEEKCSYAAYRLDGKRVATVKLPYGEWRLALAPSGDVYSIRMFRKSDVIIYKRSWTGSGTLVTSQATPVGAREPRPMYYDREMVFEDLDGRTMRELDLLRNTIYARAGNPFRKKWLHDYFTVQPWYKPLEKMDEKQLTELDKKNARMIMEYSLDLSEADLRDTAEKLQQRALKESLTADEKIEVRLLSIRLGKWYGSEKDKGEYQPNPLENPARLDKPVTLEDLSDFSRRDLRLLRNTVYARRGKPFTSETLGTYFGDMEWYHSDPSYNEKKLTKTDLQNVAVILSLERTLGGPMSEKEAQGEQSLEGA